VPKTLKREGSIFLSLRNWGKCRRALKTREELAVANTSAASGGDDMAGEIAVTFATEVAKGLVPPHR
jgi:hypothetical protein